MLKKDETEQTIFRCKVDSKQFFSKDELVSHLTEKHSDSYKVQRITEGQQEEKKETAKESEAPRQKRAYYRRKVTKELVTQQEQEPAKPMIAV